MQFTSKFQNAEVAQSVEQGTENPRVGSSILSLGTMIMKSLLETAGFFYVPILSVDMGVINGILYAISMEECYGNIKDCISQSPD